jgi:hypothetical protein
MLLESCARGVFGVGGEALGELTTVAESPGEPLTTEMIGEGLRGKVLVGGSIVTIEALRKASKIGVSGIVSGSVDQKDLTEFLGHEIGMGVTGDEDINFTLIVTEGFGIFPMVLKPSASSTPTKATERASTGPPRSARGCSDRRSSFRCSHTKLH